MYKKNLNEKLVIFDNDGTLYKTESVSVEAIQKAFQDLNLSIPTAEEILSLVGETMESFCEKILPTTTSEIHENLADRIRFHERVLIPKKAELYDNIDKVLKKLIREGFTLAICSNASVSYINLVLNTLGIVNLFKYIKGKELPKTKADLIKDILTESNPSFAILVGDTIHDINAARENNLPCIIVRYGYGKDDDIIHADFIADNPEDILTLINNLNIIS